MIVPSSSCLAGAPSACLSPSSIGKYGRCCLAVKPFAIGSGGSGAVHAEPPPREITRRRARRAMRIPLSLYINSRQVVGGVALGVAVRVQPAVEHLAALVDVGVRQLVDDVRAE